jgi:hypothetical protein
VTDAIDWVRFARKYIVFGMPDFDNIDVHARTVGYLTTPPDITAGGVHETFTFTVAAVSDGNAACKRHATYCSKR